MNIKEFTNYKKLLTLCIMLFCAPIILWSQKPDNFQNPFKLQINYTGKDSLFKIPDLGLQTAFKDQEEAFAYMNKIPVLLASKGYPVASVDSFWQQTDTLHIQLYTGQKYSWVQLRTKNIDRQALDAVGFLEVNYINKPLNILQVQVLQQGLLTYCENHGYPFASVFLDSINIIDDKMYALLVLEKGILYHIDSIRLSGKVKLSKSFMQQYLGISNGSNYNKSKLSLVDKRMTELPFLTPVQPSDLNMLGTGAILNLYAEPKKSSQVDFLVGLAPASPSNSKLLLTGTVNLSLKNMFGNAEDILLNWQQLQNKSPRLNLGFSQPYIFKSPYGINLLFDLFKRDSIFLQINALIGVQNYLSVNQLGKLFFQWQDNSLLPGGVDTNQVKVQKELPPNIDESSLNLGINYDWQATNYRYNPVKGNDISLTMVAGVRNIRENSEILEISSTSFDYASLYDSLKLESYQIRFKMAAAHFFRFSKTATFKTSLNVGYYNSPDIFLNNLFQIGGYKLLRGFNEQSIYATRYAVFTGEYRYLLSLNSYLFAFTDIGLVKEKYQDVNVNTEYFGFGLGILYETKAGLLNLSYAIGIQSDVTFNIRGASKIHFGYINYF